MLPSLSRAPNLNLYFLCSAHSTISHSYTHKDSPTHTFTTKQKTKKHIFNRPLFGALGPVLFFHSPASTCKTHAPVRHRKNHHHPHRPDASPSPPVLPHHRNGTMWQRQRRRTRSASFIRRRRRCRAAAEETSK